MVLVRFGDYLERYLVDNSYSITIKNNSVHIINYLELEDFSSTRVVVRYESGKTILLGTDLVVSKMQEDELLIIGNIKTIEV